MLIKIFLIVIAAIAIAFLIIKFLPLKLRWLISVVCVASSAYLIYLIYNSIMLPIKFEEEKIVRYQKVINKLKLIRDVEDSYRDFAGKFTASEDTLVNFVKNGKLYITQTLNVKKIIKDGQLTKEITVTRLDTIGTEPVAKYFKGRDVTNLFSVPDLGSGLDKLKFDVKAESLEKTGGLITNTIIEVFEVKIPKTTVLQGLDSNETQKECWKDQNDQVKGEYLSIGSLVKVSSKGNWPKSYDAEDVLKKKQEKEKLEKIQKERKEKMRLENKNKSNETPTAESDSTATSESEATKK